MTIWERGSLMRETRRSHATFKDCHLCCMGLGWGMGDKEAWGEGEGRNGEARGPIN